MRFPTSVLSFLTLSSLLLTSCTPTEQEIVSQYRSDLEEKRSQLDAIMANLPKEPLQEESTCPTFDPPFVMGPGTVNNAGVVMEEQLLDLTVSPSFKFFNTDDFIEPFRILELQEKGNERKSEADDRFEETLKEIINYDYLVIYRLNEYIEPETIDNNTFSMGSIKMDVFIASFETNEILCSHQISATTDDYLEYEYELLGEDKATIGLHEAQESLRTNITKAAQEKLIDITGYSEMYVH